MIWIGEMGTEYKLIVEIQILFPQYLFALNSIQDASS